jgi:hypothetical protein
MSLKTRLQRKGNEQLKMKIAGERLRQLLLTVKIAGER